MDTYVALAECIIELFGADAAFGFGIQLVENGTAVLD